MAESNTERLNQLFDRYCNGAGHDTGSLLRAFMNHTGIDEFLAWAMNKDYYALDNLDDALALQGLETFDKRVQFYKDHQKLMLAHIKSKTRYYSDSVSRYVLHQSLNKWVKTAPSWQSVAGDVTDADIRSIFAGDKRRDLHYDFFVADFVGCMMLEVGHLASYNLRDMVDNAATAAEVEQELA